MHKSYQITSQSSAPNVFCKTFVHKIAAWHSEGMSNRQIANKIGVAPQTIHNEIKRGDLKQVKLFNGKTRYFTDYNAEFAQNMYQMNRLNCHRKEKFPKARAFLSFFVPLFKTKGYSPDATVAKCHSLFAPKEMVSTTTFYKIIDDQRLEVRNIDLEMKMKRCITKKRPEKNRKVLGKSIEERPASVTFREEFGLLIQKMQLP